MPIVGDDTHGWNNKTNVQNKQTTKTRAQHHLKFKPTNEHSLQNPVNKKTKITFRSAFALLRAANNSSRISGSMPWKEKISANLSEQIHLQGQQQNQVKASPKGWWWFQIIDWISKSFENTSIINSNLL